MEKVNREKLTVIELSNRMVTAIKSGELAILSLADNWYKIGVPNLKTAPIPTNAVYFEDVNITALFAEMQSKYVYVTPLPGYSNIYLVGEFYYTAIDFFLRFHE